VSLVRVLIVDDHPLLRSGLRALVEAQADMVVVGEAGDGGEAVWKAEALRPDVVTLDITMPGPPVTRVIPSLRATGSRPRVLVVSMHSDALYVETALAAGAGGFVTKRAEGGTILKAIRAVCGRECYVDPSVEAPPAPASAPSRSTSHSTIPPDRSGALSDRELQVVAMIGRGCTYQEIADALAIGLNSIGTYRSRAAKKLGLKTRADIVRFAVDSGLVRDVERKRRRGP
jgi:DNA-binding NarL/FixJ family response regulator